MSCSKTPHSKPRYPSFDSFKCKQIGNYVLTNTIGRGTFSKVKLGIHLITQKKVAIKILDKEKIVDDNDLERISREINILKALRHQNIAQLYETISSEKHIYIIMEYIEGKDLFQFIYSKTRLSEAKTSELFRQLISSLEYIHILGVVHRDIKPENILLNKSKSTIKLVDFGLSNSYKHGHLLKTACGSPCYASPEMISGKEYNGFYSDLWSCGVVLYCMLTGNLPFDDEDIKVLYSKIRTADYVMPDYLSPISQDILHKILETNPNKRINLEALKNHPFFSLSKSNIPLSKGILIGIEPIPIDLNLISEIKKKYYHDKDKVTESYIEESIAQNNYNNLTVIYYLLLKQKSEEKQNETHHQISIPSNDRKRCDKMFNLDNIKKITFGNKKKRDFTNQLHQNRANSLNNPTTGSTNANNNSRFVNKINSGNNQVNVVVINNIVTDADHARKENKSLLKKKANALMLNLNNNSKMNTTTTFNNNVLTTKINFNEMLSHQIVKQNQNSRNKTEDSHVKRNKTVSSTNPNNYISINLNRTLSNQLRGILSKSKGTKTSNKKYLFNSPNNSTDNLNVKKVVSRNSKSKQKNEIKANQANNRFLIKRIFANESFNCDNQSMSLNITSYFNNIQKKVFSKEKNKMPSNVDKPDNNTTNSNNLSNTNNSGYTNNKQICITRGIPNAPSPNLRLFQHNSKLLKPKLANIYLKNNHSLNKSNSKDKTYGRVLTGKSLSKDKNKYKLTNNSKGKTNITIKYTQKNNSQGKNQINLQTYLRYPFFKEKKSLSLTKKIPSILKNKSLDNTMLKTHQKK